MLDNHFLQINWDKVNGLIPCIIQNIHSSSVLMLGYMNQAALLHTQKYKKVTFYSRTKKRLWTKGEKSGNFLNVIRIVLDCDQDSLLILVDPIGNTCHLKQQSCFNSCNSYYTNFFSLENKIRLKKNMHVDHSYTAMLHIKGIEKIAQKLGEESIEVVIASMKNNKLNLINESADLIYHLLVLLHYHELNFNILIKALYNRHKIL
ncbi:Histidine biosynthesis bifunctional protein HisIE [Buchnera aphidicola (Pterocallis alni)]|uniref:bifunctional phosphoribosyl-AMP cyclohydrolase/phosphoribosyl-ATP diphosphatase HisIE n=1 Tax=Buchnera aphidicola TaxID=9 RepID=UPI003463D318